MIRAVWRRASASGIAIAVLGACIGPPPDAPSAVIQIAPASVCQHDAFRTPIALDGRQSSPHMTLVPVPPDPDEPPLVMRWRIEGAAHFIESGSLHADRLTVRTQGDRPLHVTLTVVNAEGGTATSMRTLPITIPERAPCMVAEDCREGERCERFDGERRTCVPDHPCEVDVDCPPCFVCDVARATCAPRSSTP